MDELLGRVGSIFVEPAPPRARPVAAAASEPAALAVLCPPQEALALGSAVAVVAARRTRASFAVLALWRPGASGAPGFGAPASRRARALGASLRARELSAHASGRVVRLDLPHEPAAAVAATGRAMVASEAPVVFVVAGPRTEAIDELLRDQDLLLLASEDPDDRLTRLALDRLAALGPQVETIPARLSPVSRALALAGLAGPLPAPLPRVAR